MNRNLNEILQANIPYLMQWSLRDKKSTNHKRLKKRISEFLISLSGNDLIEMILDVIGKNKREILFKKFIKALKGLSFVSNKSKKKNRHHFIRPLRKAGMTYYDVKKLDSFVVVISGNLV